MVAGTDAPAGAAPTAQRTRPKLLVSQNASHFFLSTIELKSFPDKESHILIHDIESCRGQDVQILHRCYPKQDSSLLQLFLICKTVSKIANRVEAVVPYLPYARQDKLWKAGEALSAEVVCGLLASAGATSLATFDCHFVKREGETSYGGLRIRNFSMAQELVRYFREKKPDALLISPDQGAKYIVSQAGGMSMAKVRGEYTGSKKQAARPVASLSADFDVKGREVVILDDMIAGGGTMIRATRAMLDAGAKSVCCGCTHGLFLGNAYTKIQEAGAEEIVATNTIATEASKIDILEPMKKWMLGGF